MNSKIYTHTLKSGNQFKIDDHNKSIIASYIFGIAKRPHTSYVTLKFNDTRKYAGLLHRVILKINDPNIEVDHINGNGLDCTEDNLRISNPILNQQNRRITKIENGAKGLFFREDRGYWVVKIVVNKKQIVVGSFHYREDAIKARLEAEEFYFGKFNGLGTMEPRNET